MNSEDAAAMTEDVLLDAAANCTAADGFGNGSGVACGGDGGGGGVGGGGGEDKFDLWFEFAVHGVLLFSVGALGLIGNLLSVIILSRPQMKSSINTLLIGLVSCDSLLIVTSICLFSFTNFRYVIRIKC